MKIDTSEFSQGFRDMRLRVLNQKDCPVVFEQSGRGCWPYGTLFFRLLGKRVWAAFGDLVILVTAQERFILIDIATNPDSKYAGQW